MKTTGTEATTRSAPTRMESGAGMGSKPMDLHYPLFCNIIQGWNTVAE